MKLAFWISKMFMAVGRMLQRKGKSKNFILYVGEVIYDKVTTDATNIVASSIMDDETSHMHKNVTYLEEVITKYHPYDAPIRRIHK